MRKVLRLVGDEGMNKEEKIVGLEDMIEDVKEDYDMRDLLRNRCNFSR